MSAPKIAAALSLAFALSLVCYGPAQSAPLTSLSAGAKSNAEQTITVEARWRRGWHNGAAAPPSYYGGSYLGHTYGGFPGFYSLGCVFPCYGYRPFGWYWYRPY
jgi:hypothetical protein